MISDQQMLSGSFVPTTNVWDVQSLQDIDVTSPDFKELMIRLYQNINKISLVLNTKETGYYTLTPYTCGQLFFPNRDPSVAGNSSVAFRQPLRLLIDFGALPNAATKSVTHGIVVSSSTIWTRVYGTATDPIGLTGIDIGHASPVLANNIEITVDATNVNITTGSNRTNYTTCYVILEYIQF